MRISLDQAKVILKYDYDGGFYKTLEIMIKAGIVNDQKAVEAV
jgi:hypothetical protein